MCDTELRGETVSSAYVPIVYRYNYAYIPTGRRRRSVSIGTW